MHFMRFRKSLAGHWWADVVRDLDSLQEIEIRIDGKGNVLRNEVQGAAGKVFQACGVAIPSTLRPC